MKHHFPFVEMEEGDYAAEAWNWLMLAIFGVAVIWLLYWVIAAFLDGWGR